MSELQHSKLPAISPLKSASLQSRTSKSYNDNLLKFLNFNNITLVKLMRLPVHQIDSLLSSYFDYSYSVGGSFTYATYALNGLCFHSPSLRGQLGDSKRRLKGWEKLKKSTSHPPITWELTVLMAVVLAKSGFYSEAIGILLSFDCYLRVGELVSILYHNIALPNDPRLVAAHRHMALRLPKTKTGLNQWVTLNNPDVANLFLHYLQSSSFNGADRVFCFSANHFRLVIRSAATSLGLSHIPYVPHSFRHGGATTDYFLGFSIDHILHRGRWKKMESATRYIQAGRALLLLSDVPKQLNEAGSVFSTHLIDVMVHLSSLLRA
jgi:integrase